MNRSRKQIAQDEELAQLIETVGLHTDANKILAHMVRQGRHSFVAETRDWARDQGFSTPKIFEAELRAVALDALSLIDVPADPQGAVTNLTAAFSEIVKEVVQRQMEQDAMKTLTELFKAAGVGPASN